MGNWYRLQYSACFDRNRVQDNVQFRALIEHRNVEILEYEFFEDQLFLTFIMKEKHADGYIIDACKFLEPFLSTGNDPFVGIIQSDYNCDHQDNTRYARLIGNAEYEDYIIETLDKKNCGNK